MLSQMLLLEPTASEIELAAEFEAQAQRQNVPLDSGESQLAAIALSRAARGILTGDKRAITALWSETMSSVGIHVLR